METVDRRPRRNSGTVRLRLEDFNALMAEALDSKDGKTSNLAVANLLGCGEGSISRLRNGKQNLGPGLIACITTRFGPNGLARVCDFETEAAA